MSVLLECVEVSRSFGGLQALLDVSFSVRQGEIHGLIGPNGAGKSTLINALTGVYPPNRGRVVLGGRDIQGSPPHAVAALGVARTFQNIRLFPAMSCLENVLAGQHLTARRPFWPRLFALPSAAREERALRESALRLLERVGLTARAGHPAAALSYGERRRLEIARALAMAPRLLLLDEPVAGMRAHEAEEVATLVRQLQAEGMTILLIEHNMRFVMGLCERLTVLSFGQVIAHGPAEAARNDPRVIEAYLGREEDSAEEARA